MGDKATLIIGGFGGSGTRGHADFLNQLSFAQIKGEICSKRVLRDIIRLIESTSEASKNLWWEKRTMQGLYENSLDVFGMMATKSEQFAYDHNKKIIGFKSPKCEIFHKQLNSIFWKSQKRNHVFIFSCRNIFDTCLSMKNRFNSPVERSCSSVIKSVASFKALSSYNNVRVHVAQLDDLIKASKQGGENAIKQYYYENFISIANISVTRGEFEREAKYTPENRNRTRSKLFQSLSDQEKDFIINNSDLKSSLTFLEEEFGCSELQSFSYK